MNNRKPHSEAWSYTLYEYLVKSTNSDTLLKINQPRESRLLIGPNYADCLDHLLVVSQSRRCRLSKRTDDIPLWGTCNSNITLSVCGSLFFHSVYNKKKKSEIFGKRLITLGRLKMLTLRLPKTFLWLETFFKLFKISEKVIQFIIHQFNLKRVWS